MAYMNQEMKKELAPKIKDILKRHNVKGSISVDNHSQLRVTLKSGVIDFGADSINEYHYRNHFDDNPAVVAFLDELVPAMNVGNFDDSDIMTDYFSVGWYTSINLGRYDAPYVQIS